MVHFFIFWSVLWLWYVPSAMVTFRYLLKSDGEVRLLGMLVSIVAGLFGWINVLAWLIVVWIPNQEFTNLNPVLFRARR